MAESIWFIFVSNVGYEISILRMDDNTNILEHEA